MVREVAALTQPAHIYRVDGTQEEYDRLAQELVDAGTFCSPERSRIPGTLTQLSPIPMTWRVSRSAPSSASRPKKAQARPNNWRDPVEMKQPLTGLFEGSMRGRTMYVIPFVMGSES